jgi:hypothetical protein
MSMRPQTGCGATAGSTSLNSWSSRPFDSNSGPAASAGAGFISLMNQVNFDEETGEKLEVIYQARDLMRRRGLVRKALGPQPG